MTSMNTTTTIMMGDAISNSAVTAVTFVSTLSAESFAPDAHDEGTYQEKQERYSKQCYDRSESLIHLSIILIER